MSKRKLTRQQQWRIKKIQEERTARAHKHADHLEQAISEGELGLEQAGLVIAHYGAQVDIESLEGDNKGAIQRCHMRTNL